MFISQARLNAITQVLMFISQAGYNAIIQKFDHRYFKYKEILEQQLEIQSSDIKKLKTIFIKLFKNRNQQKSKRLDINPTSFIRDVQFKLEIKLINPLSSLRAKLEHYIKELQPYRNNFQETTEEYKDLSKIIDALKQLTDEVDKNTAILSMFKNSFNELLPDTKTGIYLEAREQLQSIYKEKINPGDPQFKDVMSKLIKIISDEPDDISDKIIAILEEHKKKTTTEHSPKL